MKRVFTLSLFLILFSGSFACSCGGLRSFCESVTRYHLTASGVIVGSFQYGISVKILRIFNGNDSRDTITVWDLGGPYHMCNDSITSIASHLGSVGDTLILSLPRIDTIKNSWDIIGDYQSPAWIHCYTYKLRVTDNMVVGFISGSEYCYFMKNCLESYNYDSFNLYFPEKMLSCNTWLNLHKPAEPDVFNFYPNPSTGKILIETSERGILTIQNSCGQFIEALTIENKQTKYPTGKMQPGLYFISFKTEDRAITRKLIVSH